MKTHSATRRAWALVLFSVLAMFAAVLGTTLASAGTTDPSTTTNGDTEYCQLGGSECNHVGLTDGYYDGHSVDFVYTKNFFCKEPPSSGASSHCEVGATATTQPPPSSGEVASPLWVITPIGFTPPASTLQCPVAGRCIDHPSTIDLSRVFGSGYASVALPPHSHVIKDLEHGISVWWPLRVVGVSTLSAWNTLRDGKSLDAIRSCQAAGNCTADIPTNTFLFFSAKSGDE